MPHFIQRHQIITAILVIHAIGLVTWVTLRVFGSNPPEITMGTATALGAVYGLPALAYGLWKWRGKQVDQ
jgi:hypothetical protein